MPVLKADLTLCAGYANCVDAAPDTFNIDDDDVVILLRQEVPEQERGRIQEAARTCPVKALTLEDN